MAILRWLEHQAVRWRYARLARFLSAAKPERIEALGERNLLAAFHRAARQAPAYRRLLQGAGVDPRAITRVETFRGQVPFVDKQTLFASHRLSDLCVGGNLDGIALFYSSSGHSGTFSFGVETREDIPRFALGMEFLLHTAFDVFRRKTLLINSLPMAVRVHTRSVPQAETSVRSDVVLAILRALAGDFEQFVLIGESLFLKKLAEEGAEQGLPWHDLRIHVITGGEFIPETFRSYLGHLLGTDFENPARGMIALNMGLSELASSLFFDSAQTIALRRRALHDPKLRSALFGDGSDACPELLHYYPQHTHVETTPDEAGQPILAISVLDPRRKLPLIRYKTGDVGRTLSYRALADILRPLGLEGQLPTFRLPVGILWGRPQVVELPDGGRLSANLVKEALYEDFDLAGHLTGHFRIVREGSGAKLLVQLRRDHKLGQEAADALSGRVGTAARAQLPVELVLYEKFPFALDLDYERKRQYF